MNDNYITNEKRSAHDQLAGYEYQIYSSTLAWIQLRNDEALFLERAEDHDLVRDESIVASQVKKSKSPFTLRSHEVVGAINNFWELKQKNANIRIFFRFITQTTFSKEKGSPFGEIEGIEYWKRCQRGEDVTLLKGFLLSLPSLSEELKSFLNNSSLTEIKDELVQPISWEFLSSDFSQIEYEIKLSLVEQGELLGYSAKESEAVFGTLISHCFKVACSDKSGDRKLTLNDFSEIFNKHLQIITANKKELREEIGQNKNLIENLTKVVQQTISQSGTNNTDYDLDLTQLPSLNLTAYIRRPLLEAEVKDLLIKYGFVTLTGSAGNGKSTLSVLVVKDESEKWRKISFRGMSAGEVNFQLSSLIKRPNFFEYDFIFDDLNFNQSIDLFLDTLRRIIFLLKRANKKVIITSQTKPDIQILNSINVPLETTVTIQSFATEEIEELLKQYNCPVGKGQVWANEIFTVTKGHPQMVHARIIRLSANHWDANKLFFETSELKEIKEKKARDLINELPSPESRDLAIRLSVLSKRFTTKNAYAIAESGDAIKNYRAAFNQLIGPYLEEVGKGYFQLSELLEGTYKIDYTEDEAKELHTAAGFSYIRRTLTPQDVSNIFWHAIHGRSMQLFNYALSAFMSIKQKDIKTVYSYLAWIPAITIDHKSMAIPEDDLMNNFFRSVQFTIAAELKGFIKPEVIAELWLEETKRFAGKSPLLKRYPQAKLSLFMTFLNISRYINLNFSVNFRFKLIYEAFKFINDNPAITQDVPNFLTSDETFSLSGWKGIFTETMLSVHLSSDETLQLISKIATCDLNEDIFNEINSSDAVCRRLSENLWLDSVDHKDDLWGYIVDDLKSLSAIALNSNVPNLYIQSQRSIAIIEYEYKKKKNCNDIIKFLDETNRKAGQISSDIEDYKAKVYFLEKNYLNATKIWDSLIPDWKPKFGSELIKIFALRNAGVSHAFLNSWNKAEKYFKESYESIVISKSTPSSTVLYKYQMLGEYAFSLWKNKKYRKSIRNFVVLINSLPKCPDPEKDLRSLGLLKAISNTFIHLRREVIPQRVVTDIDFMVPCPGFFSQFDYSEELRDYPVQPYKTLLTFLAEIELGVDKGRFAYDELTKSLETLPTVFKISGYQTIFLRSVKERKYKKAIEACVEMFIQVEVSKKIRESAGILHLERISAGHELRKLYLEGNALDLTNLFSVFPLVGDVKKILKNTLGSELKKSKVDSEIWNNFLLQLDSDSDSEAIMRDGNFPTSSRLLASVSLIKDGVNKDSLLYACGVLVVSLESIMFNQMFSKFLLQKMLPIWQSIGKIQHEIWRDTESAQLIYACENKLPNDLQTCANILLKAKELCFIKIDAVQEQLEAIANNKYFKS